MKFMRLKSSTTNDESQCNDCTTVSFKLIMHTSSRLVNQIPSSPCLGFVGG